MKRHWSYLKYLLRHKWFVAVAGTRLGLGWWRLAIHDWHKFLPSEWGPYARTFYNADGSKKTYHESEEFMRAWNLHQKRGRHHWQHWMITWDRGETVPLRMDNDCAVEMVADWMGAGRAITGKWDVNAWYSKNKGKIQMHHDTRWLVELVLSRREVVSMEEQQR